MRPLAIFNPIIVFLRVILVEGSKKNRQIDLTKPEICTGCQHYRIAITLSYGGDPLSGIGASKHIHKTIPRPAVTRVGSLRDTTVLV